MTSPERRAELMREEGIEQVLILPFTPELARLSPEEFVTADAGGAAWARARCWWATISASGTGTPGMSQLLAELGAAARIRDGSRARGDVPRARS